MKKTIIAFIAALMISSAGATVIPSTNGNIAAANIEKVVRLVDKKEDGSSQKKVQIVIVDNGMSTDVSPRYSVLLGFASLAEMGNIATNFLINDEAMEFLSAKRLAAGIYEIKVVEYREEGMFEVTQVIDATEMFIAEKKARELCGDDFCDQELKTNVTVKEVSAVKI